MQRSENTQSVKSIRRKTKASTTLRREYVGRPSRKTGTRVEVRRSARIQHFNTADVAVKDKGIASDSAVTKQESESVKQHPLQQKANVRMQSRQLMNNTQPVRKETAKELKDKAISQALAMASASSDTGEPENKLKKTKKIHFGVGRVILAMSCAAVVVFAIVYFVNLNMPDVSMKVAAMQTGINASYPDYVPRDYAISSITSEDKKITLKFKNSSNDKEFTLVEETSSWDSNALLNNYVKEHYGDNYAMVR